MINRLAVKRNKGFTLMEILVVMAISMILMVLVMAPVIRSFEMTRQAQAMVDAQDSARVAMERVSREIGESMDILDYTADPIEVPVYDPNSGSTYNLPLPYGKIDMILPKMIAHCNSPDHDPTKPRDFERGDQALPMCPSGDNSTDVDIRPKLPIEQGNTVVRYFLGLKYNDPDPVATDTPPHPGWQSAYGKDVLANEGNPVVLYRIEFDPSDKTIFSDDPTEAAQQLMDVLRDPLFFYSTATANDGQELWRHWSHKARALGLAKYQDLVAGMNPDPATGRFTALEPSVTFKYGRIDKETFTGVDYGNSLAEFPEAPPTVYRAKFGYWTPNSVLGITQPYGVYVYRYAHNNGAIDTSNTTLYYTDVNGGSNELVIKRSGGGGGTSIVFNISQYMADGYVNLSQLPAGCDMGFYFDYANDIQTPPQPLLNFNRGVVNFGLAMKPVVLDDAGINDINQSFLARLALDRNPVPRGVHLPLPRSGNTPTASVVPGSEVVTGPDMTRPEVTNPAQLTLVRYERVPYTAGDAGTNQYKINYVTGDVFFSRVPSQDIPPVGMLSISYKIQFNKADDVIQADYQTKAMINIHLGIRMYDPDSGEPHMVELNSAVKLRNAYR